MSQHTPGPWVIDDGDSDVIGVFAGSDSDHICYLCENAHDFVGSGRGRDTDEANARLIAAAPDLLQACKEVLPYLDGSQGHDIWRGGVAAMKAAIAKAEGRSA